VDLQDGERCLFINRDGLDLRRRNLKRVTQREVSFHQPKKRPYKRFKGVFFDARRGRWWAQCEVDDKRHFGGYYDTEEEAARAYDALAKRLHKEFALLNEELECT
jgi:hypothetical protein